MTTNLVPKSSTGFVCEHCDYYTSRKSQYDRHLSTAKHYGKENASSWQVNASEKVPKSFRCICGKEYKHDSSYYKNKKKCSFVDNSLNNEENISFTTEEIEEKSEEEKHSISEKLNTSGIPDPELLIRTS